MPDLSLDLFERVREALALNHRLTISPLKPQFAERGRSEGMSCLGTDTRYDLHFIDRGEHLKRRKELYEKKYPETKAGNVRAIGMHKALGHDVDEIISPTFTEDTASKLNITGRTVQQEIQIAENLAPEVYMPVTGMTILVIQFQRHLR